MQIYRKAAKGAKLRKGKRVIPKGEMKNSNTAHFTTDFTEKMAMFYQNIKSPCG